MDTVVVNGNVQESKKMPTSKFLMWVAIASIIMMFGGFTSAYVVKRNQASWQSFDLPSIFWVSTALIILSSITLYICVQKYKHGKSILPFFILTAILGVLFISFQLKGFEEVTNSGIQMIGTGSVVSGSFLYVIAGIHILHILGGLVAIFIMLFKYSSPEKSKRAGVLPLEVFSIYWHFIGILWIYLVVFFYFAR